MKNDEIVSLMYISLWIIVLDGMNFLPRFGYVSVLIRRVDQNLCSICSYTQCMQYSKSSPHTSTELICPDTNWTPSLI